MESPSTPSVGFVRPIILAISFIVVFIVGLYVACPHYGIQMYQSLYKTIVASPSNASSINTNSSERKLFLDIAQIYGTDKVTAHHYEVMYEKYLRKYVGSNVTLLEIGLGCGMPYGPGSSVHVWRHYLGPLANIYFLEFNRACGEDWYRRIGFKLNVTMFYGSQDDALFLKNVNSMQGSFDVIIDDGGHSMNQQITSFNNLVPKVKSGGIYVIEDLLTSYMDGYGGGYLRNSTTIEYIKKLVDNVQAISPQKSIQVANRIRSFEVADEICFFTIK